MTRQEKIKARIQDFAKSMSTNASYSIVDHAKKYNISEATAKGDLKVAQPISDAIEDKMFEAQEAKRQAELEKFLEGLKTQ